jgi:3-hydroxyanthranilate 3,4-dioxygenase
MPLREPFSLQAWIDENRHLLKPPVGNKMVWKDSEIQVMIVGGPNRRKDYHIDPGEEFFYQIEGEMTLKVIDDGKPRDLLIRPGEIFLLPPFVPHSPQRGANTVGMVVERHRDEGEQDALRWYCENCWEVLHEASLQVVDLASQLKPIIEGFYADVKLRTCRKCGTVMPPPPPVA